MNEDLRAELAAIVTFVDSTIIEIQQFGEAELPAVASMIAQQGILARALIVVLDHLEG